MNFLKALTLIAVLNTSAVGVVQAQNTPSGPVHFPAATATAPLRVNAAPTAPTVQQNAPSTSDATAGDIRDIRGPISIPYEWLWVAYLLGGLAIGALLYALWRFLRRPRAMRPKSPFEIALERLEAARSLMTTDTVRDYAFTVSEIIRVYIEQRFGEKAAHRTTEEFLSDLLQQTGTPLAVHRRLLEDFLSHCDLSKFARWQFSIPEMESMHESARNFIMETQPQPEPAKTAVAPALPQPELVQVK